MIRIFAFTALAGLLLLLLLMGTCSYFVRQTREDLEREKPEIESAGKDFGTSTDELGCLKEAAVRVEKNESIKGAAFSATFLNGCLKTCVATPGFCDDVPKWDDRFKSGAWALAVCNELGQSSTYCRKVMEQIPQYCDRTRYR
jgi:hypothetical protein